MAEGAFFVIWFDRAIDAYGSLADSLMARGDAMVSSQSETFPVTSSVLSAGALRQEVTRAYCIGEVEDCRLIRRGLSDSYLVRTAEAPYVLRIYRPSWRTVSEILYEIDMLCYLSQHGAYVD